MPGADYAFSERWTYNTELRYARFSSIELKGEESISELIKDLEYDPLTLGFGVKYTF